MVGAAGQVVPGVPSSLRMLISPGGSREVSSAMRHLGILAHSVEGAALCLRTFCQRGSVQLGPHQHPDVTLDCIAFGPSMPAWDAQDFATIRTTLATSVTRLAHAGADFFVCPGSLTSDRPPIADGVTQADHRAGPLDWPG